MVLLKNRVVKEMSYYHLDDIELLELLQQNDQEAFSEIYNRYWKLLYATACKVIGDGHAAQDAIQEVFIALWHRRHEAKIQVLKAYLQQAVRFQVLKCIRTRKTNQEFYTRLAAVTAEIVYENPLLFKEQQNLLLSIMNRLPEDCRLVFTLSREAHLTYKQIASQLNISEKTVEKKMSICLKKIREALNRNEWLSVALLIAFNCRS